MATSIFIIVVSAALMIYWFRYTCLLMLRTRTGEDYAADLAEANKLGFKQVGEDLVRSAVPATLSELEQSLERDYRLLTYLLAHTAGRPFGGITLEQRMLMLDFRLMGVVYRISGRLSLGRARAAVLEMADVLNYLANDVGKRSHAASRA
ncbi:MAG: hypothetical protein IT159_11410 [Bryobacterales bacterium]|mgnify:CR=1 FL=1|nr:hypothetical protein [Bryobacterales bacterium]